MCLTLTLAGVSIASAEDEAPADQTQQAPEEAEGSALDGMNGEADKPCVAEIKKLCPERKGLKECIKANKDKISEECRGKLKKRKGKKGGKMGKGKKGGHGGPGAERPKGPKGGK